MPQIKDITDNLTRLAVEAGSGVGAVHDAMDSEEFNEICLIIQSRLNALYEKIRLLQEVGDFTETYVDESIKEKEAMFRERLKIIEDASDVYKDSSSVSIMVPFEQSNDIVYDRDGTLLPKMNIRNSKLEPGGSVLANAQMSYINAVSDDACNNNSYNNLLTGGEGSSFYMTDQVIAGGLKERVTVMLKSPTDINHISINPVNATASDYVLINNDHTESPMSNDGQVDDKRIEGIRFTLTCSEPQEVNQFTNSDAYLGEGKFGYTTTAYTRRPDERLIKNMQDSIDQSERSNNVLSVRDNYKYWNENDEKVVNKNTMLVEEFKQ